MTLPRDVMPGGIILAICAWLYYETTQFESDPLGMAQGMPATHMPQLVITCIAVLTILMMVQGVISKLTDSFDAPPWKMWATAAILGTAAILFVPVGVPLVFFSVCIALPLLWGARNYAVVGLFAVSLPIAIYLVFQGLLGLRLPLGPLGFMAI
ncbi:MAG: tripartite tricarboxylate transporter TctB family protein [Rhodospirillaceae bacterium]